MAISTASTVDAYLAELPAARRAAIEPWFTDRYRRSGKRLDMGKSCVRFRTIDDLPLDLIGETIAATTAERFIAIYEAARARR
jgi:hypothetical protein